MAVESRGFIVFLRSLEVNVIARLRFELISIVVTVQQINFSANQDYF